MSSNDSREYKNDDAFVLGLTGGIGTGKSTAAEHIVSRGFRHIDADAIGRELTTDGSPLLKILDETFGKDDRSILYPDGGLDRKALADIVFNDPKQKQKLDNIMFSKIGQIIRDRIADPGLKAGEIYIKDYGTDETSCHAPDDGEASPVLLDAPLLFEAGLDGLCDKTILITCDLDSRIERVMHRDNTSAEKILARIRSQMSDDEKKARADYIVDNSGSIHGLIAQLDDILSHLDKQ